MFNYGTGDFGTTFTSGVCFVTAAATGCYLASSTFLGSDGLSLLAEAG